jgi:hypothetical protein
MDVATALWGFMAWDRGGTATLPHGETGGQGKFAVAKTDRERLTPATLPSEMTAQPGNG